jgi:hypothetical protein
MIMPRYFFHIEGDRPYHDEFGDELSHHEAAWREALRLARDIEDGLVPGRNWRLVVCLDDTRLYTVEISTKDHTPKPEARETIL